jgi:glycosyltransferase involved in cell wall biosynthesis
MARLVTERMPGKEIHFVWVGRQDSDFTAWCLEDISNGALSDRIHTPGPLGHPGLFYAAADLFVLPSREDPFPTVCLEAMEAALPVVAFQDAGGIGEAVGSDAGIFVPYLDVYALATAVEHLIDHPELRSSLGFRGKQRVKDRFQLSDYVNFLFGLMYPSIHLNCGSRAAS